MTFVVGEKVRCVESRSIFLTVGKTYTVEDVSTDRDGVTYVIVRSDNGYLNQYVPRRFKSLEMNRTWPPPKKKIYTGIKHIEV